MGGEPVPGALERVPLGQAPVWKGQVPVRKAGRAHETASSGPPPLAGAPPVRRTLLS